MTKHTHGARAADPAEQRRVLRELVDFGTEVDGRSGRQTVRVVNISPMGLMGRTDADMQKGDRLNIQLPHVRALEAIVRWVEDGRIGTEFTKPVPADDYALMLVSMPRRQRAW